MDEARERGLSILAGCALCLAVLFPITQNWAEDPVDGFPLSYYPMFSKKRDGRAKVYHLVAYDAEGERHPVSYRAIGTGGFNQVRRQTRRIMRDGDSDALCREVAERLAESDRAGEQALVEVRAVVAWYDFDAFFRGDKTPISEEVWGSCPIP
ncbi:MAG: hypothetical protein AAF682_02190 [Planctomycetota bacterium]